jgi:hypothetical protein
VESDWSVVEYSQNVDGVVDRKYLAEKIQTFFPARFVLSSPRIPSFSFSFSRSVFPALFQVYPSRFYKPSILLSPATATQNPLAQQTASISDRQFSPHNQSYTSLSLFRSRTRGLGPTARFPINRILASGSLRVPAIRSSRVLVFVFVWVRATVTSRWDEDYNVMNE